MISYATVRTMLTESQISDKRGYRKFIRVFYGGLELNTVTAIVVSLAYDFAI